MLKVDKKGNWVLGNGENNFLTPLTREALTQTIITKLQEIKEDCYWSPDSGISLYTGNSKLIQYEMTQICKSIPGIADAEVVDFALDDNRLGKYKIAITLDSGIIFTIANGI